MDVITAICTKIISFVGCEKNLFVANLV